MAKNDLAGTDMGMHVAPDPAYDKLKAKQEDSEKAKSVLRGAGYARGGGVSPLRAKKIADKEVHEHEKHDHTGKKETKLKHGGKIDGKKSHTRADKYARGGSVPRGHTKVNINVGSSAADRQEAMKKGVALGAQMAMAKMAGGARPGAGAPMQARGPMPGPAPMAPGAASPMGGGVPPTMQKHGGRTYAKGGKVGPVRVPGVPHLKGGAGGGLGRREKIKDYGTKPKK